jgi:DnaK suppressor protein
MEDERAIRANQRQLLQEVEAALERIEHGTYGICTNCGRPIDEKRLEAMPWAPRDIVCEEQLEERQSDEA